MKLRDLLLRCNECIIVKDSNDNLIVDNELYCYLDYEVVNIKSGYYKVGFRIESYLVVIIEDIEEGI